MKTGALRSALAAWRSEAGVRCRTDAGFTLVEMLAVMTLLGITAGVAAMSLALGAEKGETQVERLERARDSAARYGVAVTVPMDSSPVSDVLLVLPDGRVIGATSELMSDGAGKQAR